LKLAALGRRRLGSISGYLNENAGRAGPVARDPRRL
jgi:hypothetical protein